VQEPHLLRLALPADLETPISVALKLGIDNEPYSFLLESVEDGEHRGRYSVIGLAPDLIWRVVNGRAEIKQGSGAFVADSLPPFDSLRKLIAQSAFALPSDLPAIAAGLFGYMGYDMIRYAERLPQPNPDRLNLPEAIFIRPSRIVLFDSVKDEMLLLAIARSPEQRKTSQQALEKLKNTLSCALTYPDQQAKPLTIHIDSNTPKEEYLSMVRKTIDYINAGDISQPVISQRFATPFPLPAFSFYRALRMINPSPYLYFMNFQDFHVVGSSPEILVRVQGKKMTIRPIAGTAPRLPDPQQEQAAAEKLLADPKERAEHLMLLDLGRNDVGRVAKIGSIQVNERFALQWTSHLIHIVSNVEGEIADNYDTLDAMIAGFPAGTVSGAPKIRAMEIIDELEKEKRGAYAGALGYFSANGDMDSCIILRTGVIKDQTLYVQAGGGIVADSHPESEYLESVNKAKALHHAASLAHQFAPLPRKMSK